MTRKLFFKIGLLLLLVGRGGLYGQMNLMQRDSQKIEALSALHRTIQNYQVNEEINLFSNIIDSLEIEILEIEAKGIKSEKETIKIFFEEFHTNLTQLRATQIANDSLFNILTTTQCALFEDMTMMTTQKKKNYRKKRKSVGLKKLYRLYHKNLFQLEKHHRLTLLNTKTFDKFFQQKGWQESPLSQLIAYINQSLLGLQKNRIDVAKQEIDSIITQLENQIACLLYTSPSPRD